MLDKTAQQPVLLLSVLIANLLSIYSTSFPGSSPLLGAGGRETRNESWNASLKATRGRGGGGTPYNGLYGEAPPERSTFFRLQVYKRVGISQV